METKTLRNEKESKCHKLDHLTEIIGPFGLYHGVTFFVMSLTIVIHAWQSMANKFYTRETEYWCRRPALLNNIPVDRWMNLSSPILESGDFDRCHIFDVDYQTLEQRPGEDTPVLKCTSWEYATEPFDVRTIFEVWSYLTVCF